MAGTSTSDARTRTSTSDYDDIALSVIKKQLRSLRKKHNRILRMEESADSQGKPLNKEQEEILRSKSITVDCIEELEMLIEEKRGSFQVPLIGSSMPVSKPDEVNNSVPKLKRELMNPVEKGRYLCITDGVVICCLDLKHSKDESNDSSPQPVAKISSLKLLEMGLPISIGLFKLGSDVYMIGGQEFPGFKKDPNSWGRKLLNDLYYSKQSVQGSSCDTYRVCLSNGSLSILECSKIRPMNLPKFWPIVEKIDDKIHVIESLPSELGFYCPDTVPSHEFLDLSDISRGWTVVSPLPEEDEELDFHVSSHIVVDDQIYARAHRVRNDQVHLVFDSKTTKWQVRGKADRNDVARMDFSSEWGARQFLAGESEEPLYVVIGVGEVTYPVKKQDLRARLVSCKTGRLIGEQRLPDILEGFEQPFTVSQGTLVDVDGKTMCVVLHVNVDGGCREGFLYMSVFSMEEVEDARSLVEAGQWSEENYNHTRTKDFVKVVVKQRYIYNLDEYLGKDDDIGESFRLRACFF